MREVSVMQNIQKRKTLGALLGLGMMLISPCITWMSVNAQEAKGIKVQYHTQQEITTYIKKKGIDINQGVEYKKQPSITSPYKAGTLTDKTLNEALETLNAMRYIAGIDDTVTLDNAYNEKTQAAALTNAANHTLSHYPSHPSSMSKSLYELGAEGARSSNLAWTSWKTGLNFAIVNAWMEDGDSYNIDRVGHRRWILNPTMGKTGFGAVYHDSVGTYTAMYCFDYTNHTADYYGVSWPAQNMPIEYFGSGYPWSISMGEVVDTSKVKVVLTRVKDGKKWTFSQKKSNGYFSVNNGGYGQSGCIIFRPDNVSYAAGDAFQVEISGLTEAVSYTVSFFSLDQPTGGNVEKEKITNVKLAKKSYEYDGKKHTPDVVVKDSNGKELAADNYAVKYSSGRKNVGRYQVTVTMKGDYKGKKTLTFDIVPKSTNIQKLTAKKKGFQVRYKKVKDASGYEIAYSENSNFSKATTKTELVKSGKKTKITVKACDSKKKYYVKVRSYQQVSFKGKKVKLYSKWSKAKTVKVK